MLKVLFSSRMLAFHALVLVVVPTFIWLGFWQLDRWETRSAAVNLQQENVEAEHVPVEELAEVGSDVAPADRWRTVEVKIAMKRLFLKSYFCRLKKKFIGEVISTQEKARTKEFIVASTLYPKTDTPRPQLKQKPDTVRLRLKQPMHPLGRK